MTPIIDRTYPLSDVAETNRIEFENGTWYRQESKDNATTIRNGKLGVTGSSPAPPIAATMRLRHARGAEEPQRAARQHRVTLAEDAERRARQTVPLRLGRRNRDGPGGGPCD